MSQTQTTQTTKDTLSNDLPPKRRGRPKIDKTEEKTATHTMSINEDPKVDDTLRLSQMLLELESKIHHAKIAGYEWMEVARPVLMHFTRGETPEAG